MFFSSSKKAAPAASPDGPTGGFDAEAMHKNLITCLHTEDGKLTILALPFLEALNEVPKLLSSLMSNVGLLNRGITDKHEIVLENVAPTAEHLNISQDRVTLEQIIERDITNKWTHTGKKVARQHATRNVVRLVWFLDFIYDLFNKLSANSSKSLKLIFEECWNSALKPRQNFMVKAAVAAALKVAPVPQKQKFLEEELRLDYSTPEATTKSSATLTSYAEDILTLKTHLWSFFKSNGVDNVP